MNEYAGRGSKKGTKANHREDRLVNITNGKEIRRIRWGIANKLVNEKTGWNFCPKKFKLEVS
jgi:hypothetical protein